MIDFTWFQEYTTALLALKRSILHVLHFPTTTVFITPTPFELDVHDGVVRTTQLYQGSVGVWA